MTLPLSFFRRLNWLNAPGALLILLLQRSPVVRLATAAEEFVVASPIGALLRSAVAAATALGTVHSLAGATQYVQSPSGTVTGTVGQTVSVSFTVTGSPTPPFQYFIDSDLPPGMTTVPAMQGNRVPSGTPTITGAPTQAGTFMVSVTASDGSFAQTDTITFVIAAAPGGGGGTAPSVSSQPTTSQVPTAGGFASISVAGSGSPAPTIQWQRNGSDIAGATGTTLTLADVQPPAAGIYRAVLTNATGTASSSFSILGIASTSKVIGTGTEVGTDILHPNNNIFDQVQLTGGAATVKADAGQVLRISYIDLNDDIVQVEFSGAGNVTLLLDSLTGPATPTKYNQPNSTYMRGHAGIVVTDADESSNMTVFTVGRSTALNQALFSDSVSYDGVADIAFVAITSRNGKFGGLRTANARYFHTRGITGVYAPGVEFQGPVFVGNINARDNSTPVYIIGGGNDVRINGGNLKQENGRAVQVDGIAQLKFTGGSDSHGTNFPAQNNEGKLERNGTDVTATIVLNPGG